MTWDKQAAAGIFSAARAPGSGAFLNEGLEARLDIANN
jgi:hypothetical protein